MKSARRDAGADRDALRAAFERHHVRLLRLGVLLSGRLGVAEDLVQDAFLRAAPHIARLPDEEVGAYMRTVLVNLWRNRLRRLSLERRAGPREPGGASEPAIEDRDELWRAILRLPPRQRACLVLRYYEDLTEAQTAAVLGSSVSTVKSQTSRALAKLRKELVP